MRSAYLFISSWLISAFAFVSANDSTSLNKVSSRNDTWFNCHEPDKNYSIDSTIYNLEEYNFIQRGGKEYLHIGNTGGAAYPLVFDATPSKGFTLGYQQFNIYRYHIDSIRYYRVIRPYAELSMILGLNNEQLFQGKFAHMVKNVFLYGVDFTRIFSRGIYQNQRANNNGFNLYGIYNSNNKRWNVQADLIFNQNKVQENGGVTLNPFDSSFFQKKLVPVLTNSAENNYRQIDFHLKAAYSIGKTYLERKNDSVLTRVLMPVFKISYRFNLEQQLLRFRDMTPNPAFYNEFYFPDSVTSRIQYIKAGNAVMLDLTPRKLTSDSTYEEKDFIAHAEAGYDYYHLKNNFAYEAIQNLYVSGYVRNNFASRSHFIYRGAATYFLYGWNRNDLLLDAHAGYDFGKYGTITGNFSYQLKEAPFIFERNYYFPQSWEFNLPKTKIMSVGGSYHNSIYGVMADVNYYIADHLPVYPGQSDPYLTKGVENIIVFHAANRHSVVGLHFDNDIWYTYAATDGLVRSTFPSLVTRSSIYYENRLFKKALWFSLGVDVRYRFRNNAPYYDPFLGVFYPAFATNKSYPILDVFLNVKIKTVRIFLKIDNLSSALGGKGYFSAYQYPAADLSFRAGVRWRFYE